MRIIAGKLKGLKLNEFEADNIRPTIDRVREAIFNKIQFQIKDACVLDLFCGTGAVSLEFLSRGAKVVSVDNNLNSVKLINDNFKKAKLVPNLLQCDYKQALKRLQNEKFDIVFLDPPFDSDYAEKSMQILCENGMLKSNSMIVYEHHMDKEFVVPQNLEILEQKKYGTVIVSYLGVKNDWGCKY